MVVRVLETVEIGAAPFIMFFLATSSDFEINFHLQVFIDNGLNESFFAEILADSIQHLPNA